MNHGQVLQTMAKRAPPLAARKLWPPCMTAAPQVCLAGGKTPPVHIERGTLQGDSLSPLLFIIALEPLLRWLNAGGRGVRLGSNRAGQLKVASAAYANDLLILAASAEDFAIQARKIERFSGGTGLQCLSKCMLTGALWVTCQAWGDGHPFSDNNVHMLQDRLQGVKLAGGTPDVMDPVKLQVPWSRPRDQSGLASSRRTNQERLQRDRGRSAGIGSVAQADDELCMYFSTYRA